MAEDVFTPIAKGYDFIREGNWEAAENQFKEAVKRDPSNPFALNNLAAIQAQKGKLNDALANLKAATTYANNYQDKVEQTCFVAGTCMAVKPVKVLGPTSTIAPIIQDNIQKVQAKIAATGTPPPAPTLPPMK
jgi:tetratricopeptide (TPR) repeat protein